MNLNNMNEMRTPYFSIIIPTYNRANKLTETINSVLSQEFKDFELIIIDDGSTDNTYFVVKNIFDDRIKYYYQENAERSIARNNGIERANGQYICFLDSDDLFCSNHLSELYYFIKQHNEAKALFFTDQLVKDGNDLKELMPTVFDDNNTLEFILTNSIMPVRVCVHKEILKKFKFNPNYIVVEDTILWAEITNVYPIIHLKKNTVIYCVHDDNSVNQKNNAFQVRLNGLKFLFKNEQIKKRLNSRLKNKAIAVCYYGIARHFAFKRNFVAMVKNTILSIIYDFKSPQNKAKLYMIYSYFKK
jgi:glycosyltransferase involved in cell wall biosynthesis